MTDSSPDRSPADSLGTCPDCRCVKVREDNTAPTNSTAYCDYCLLDRVRAGERVPMLAVHGVDDTDPDDAAAFRKERWFYHLCDRCGGSGEMILTAWQKDTICYGCAGAGFTATPAQSVQRWQRWSATFQSNKEAEAKSRRPLE